jgi:hypothetical protein
VTYIGYFLMSLTLLNTVLVPVLLWRATKRFPYHLAERVRAPHVLYDSYSPTDWRGLV